MGTAFLKVYVIIGLAFCIKLLVIKNLYMRNYYKYKRIGNKYLYIYYVVDWWLVLFSLCVSFSRKCKSFSIFALFDKVIIAVFIELTTYILLQKAVLTLNSNLFPQKKSFHTVLINNRFNFEHTNSFYCFYKT